MPIVIKNNDKKTQSVDEARHSPLRCSICNRIITSGMPEKTLSIYNLKAHACKTCCKKFNDEDLELAVNLLMIYGGYFGQFKFDWVFDVPALLKSISSELKSRSEPVDPSKLNMMLMHEALLRGITPREYLVHITEQHDSF